METVWLMESTSSASADLSQGAWDRLSGGKPTGLTHLEAQATLGLEGIMEPQMSRRGSRWVSETVVVHSAAPSHSHSTWGGILPPYAQLTEHETADFLSR